MAKLTALFDSTDSAELALSNLRRSGIALRAAHIAPSLRSVYAEAFRPAPSALHVAGYQFGLGLMVNQAPDREAERLYRDTGNVEVVLHLDVPQAALSKAQSALLSNHGRHVQRVGDLS